LFVDLIWNIEIEVKKEREREERSDHSDYTYYSLHQNYLT